MSHPTCNGNTAALCDAILSQFTTLEDAARALTSCDRKAVGCKLYRIQRQVLVDPSTFFVNQTITKAGTCNGESKNCGCMHAEQQAVLYAKEDARKFTTMLCTSSPCVNCANLIAVSQTSIKKFFYGLSSSDKRGIAILEESGIVVASKKDILNLLTAYRGQNNDVKQAERTYAALTKS